MATDSPLEVVFEKDDSKLDEVVVTAIGIKQQKKQIDPLMGGMVQSLIPT